MRAILVAADNRSKRRRNEMMTKQDFTIFAERRENQRIHISPQLTLATFQYLSTSEYEKVKLILFASSVFPIKYSNVILKLVCDNYLPQSLCTFHLLFCAKLECLLLSECRPFSFMPSLCRISQFQMYCMYST